MQVLDEFLTIGDKLVQAFDPDEMAVRCAEDDWLVDRLLRHMRALTCRRYKRCMWFLRGWPARSVMLLSPDDAVRRNTMQLLRSDAQRYAKLLQHVDEGKAPA